MDMRLSPTDRPAAKIRASRLRRKAITCLIVLGAAAVIYQFTGRRSSVAIAPVQAPAVAVAMVTRGDFVLELRALGTVTPLSTVTVKSRVSGYLTSVGFKEGQIVQKGDVLAQIDARPYEASLAQYQGQLMRDQALLHNAQLDLVRFQKLMALDSTSRKNLDTAAATVQQYEGIVQSDQAQIDGERLNIDYCRIVASTGGRVGLRQTDAGNYVQPTDVNGLVVITQIQPTSVIFTIPQTQVGLVLKRIHAGASLNVRAFDSDGTTLLDAGKLDTIDNQIEPSTGTLKLRAGFDNKDGDLFPNQFVNADLVVDVRHDALLAPTTAIRYGASGAYVYLVHADDTVAAQAISVGASRNGRTLVLSGLSTGDRVVVDGVDRLSDGMRVAIRPGGVPAPAAVP